MKKRFKIIDFALGICVLLLCTLSQNVKSQIITGNDGFEGVSTMASPPSYWYNNSDGCSTIDTQPGPFDNYIPASEGNTYVSLVTRSEELGGTVETVWAELKRPFELGKCYTLHLDLSLTDQLHAIWGFDEMYFNNPCVFEVIGCNTPLDTELLWRSEPITNFNWQTYEITFTPQKNSYSKIAFRANYVNGEKKNSAILVDRLTCLPDPTGFTPQDSGLTLPGYATNIQWYLNGNLIAGDTSHVLPYIGNGLYQTTYYDASNCLRTLSENVELNTDFFRIFPNPTSDVVHFEFNSTESYRYEMYLYNDIGKWVLHQYLDANIGKNNSVIDLSLLAPGSYYLKIIRPNFETISSKIIVLPAYR
jgi:hypothetical protein